MMFGVNILGFTLVCFVLVQTSVANVNCIDKSVGICKQDICLFVKRVTNKTGTCSRSGGANFKVLVGEVMENYCHLPESCQLTPKDIFCGNASMPLNDDSISWIATTLLEKNDRKSDLSNKPGQSEFVHASVCDRLDGGISDDKIFDDVVPLKSCDADAVAVAAAASQAQIDAVAVAQAALDANTNGAGLQRALANAQAAVAQANGPQIAAATQNRRKCHQEQQCVYNVQAGYLCYPTTLPGCGAQVRLLQKHGGTASANPIYNDQCEVIMP